MSIQSRSVVELGTSILKKEQMDDQSVLVDSYDRQKESTSQLRQQPCRRRGYVIHELPLANLGFRF
jgi:hypothetical protein